MPNEETNHRMPHRGADGDPVMIKSSGRIKQQGFTLLEVLIALVVATIGLLSLSAMQISAIKANGMSNRATQSVFLAQDMIERIKGGNMVDGETFGFMNMADIHTGVVRDSGVLPGINESGRDGGPFTVQWQVLNHTGWSRKVVVDVSWYSISGMTRNVSLSSISRGGGN